MKILLRKIKEGKKKRNDMESAMKNQFGIDLQKNKERIR